MDGVGAIDPDLTGLSHSAPARTVPFLVEGGPRWVRGVESRSGFTVGRGARPVASVDAPGLGAAANVLLFPGIVRRDFTSSRGSCVETLLTASTLALVVAEWRIGSGRLPERIVVELYGQGGEVVCDDASKIVLAHADHGVGLAFSSGPGSAGIEGGGADGLRVVFEPEGSDTLSIALAFGGSGEIDRALAGARHANAHAVRAAAGPETGLLLRTGVPEIDDGTRWLRSRLVGRIGRCVDEEDVGGTALLGLGLAALGVGDRESAELLLSAIPGTSAGWQASTGSSSSPRISAHRALLAARFASVFGDTRPASAVAGAWTSGQGDGEAQSGTLTRLALNELAEALHGAADPGTLAMLRRLAAMPAVGRELQDPTAGSAERRLPMMAGGRSFGGGPSTGRSSGGDPTDWLAGLLEGNPSAAAPSHDRPAIGEVRTATSRFVTDPDAAWVPWRRLLTEPLGGDAPSMLWDSADPSRERGAGSLAAELLIALAYGLLGLRPDAAAGRIRIAPRMPSHVTRFEAAGIAVGGSSIGLRYERSDGVLRYQLSPEVAAVPPLVVLEPSVSGRVRSLRIDGDTADLDVRTSAGRTVIPVQLPLDGVRILEIETAGGDRG